MKSRPMRHALAAALALATVLGAAPTPGFSQPAPAVASPPPTHPDETRLPPGPFTLIGGGGGASYYLLPDRRTVIGREIETAMLGVFVPAREAGGKVTFAIITERFDCAAHTFYGIHIDLFDEAGGHIAGLDHMTAVTGIDPGSPAEAAATILCDGGPAQPDAADAMEALAQTRANTP